MDDAELETLRRAKSTHELRLISKARVRSVAIGRKERGGPTTDELCIRVGVVRKLPVEQLDERDVIDSELPVDWLSHHRRRTVDPMLPLRSTARRPAAVEAARRDT